MQNLGLFSTDAVLTAWGFSAVFHWISVFFVTTKWGMVFLTLSVLVSLPFEVRQGQWMKSLKWMIFATIVFLLCIPKITVMPHQATWVKAYEEGHEARHEDEIELPMLLVAGNAAFDGLIYAFISLMQKGLPEEVSFLNNQFAVFILPLNMQSHFWSSFPSLLIKEKIEHFANQWVWISLAQDRGAFWINEEEMLQELPSQGQIAWKNLKQHIKGAISTSKSWKMIMTQMKSLMGTDSLNRIENQIAFYVLRQFIYPIKQPFINEWVYQGLKNMIHFIGMLMAAIWLFFIPLMMGALVFRSLTSIYTWLKTYLWIKSLWVITFLVYFLHVMILQRMLANQDGLYHFLSRSSWAIGLGSVCFVMALLTLFGFMTIKRRKVT